ncbi:hypothetical protein BGZ93_003539 [Podila epicladia]|nr:hypothetical protein BGZ93_003539 [Podila epicladia]
MTILPLFILDIPHVANTITDALSFDDLLNCVLVNRAWHKALLPILWQNVESFRCTACPQEHKATMNRRYRHCFVASLSRNALQKYSPHIRVLTCRGHDILEDLLQSDCSNLLHINYLVQMDERFSSFAYAPDLFSLGDEQEPQMEPQTDPPMYSRPIGMGLSTLTKLIARNPYLRAVSIEIPVVETEDVCELMTFVASLDQFPSVTCFYIEVSIKDSSMRMSLQREILKLRLDAIGRQRVKHLVFRRSHQIQRINRGQPDGLPLGRYGPWRGHRTRSMEPQETLYGYPSTLAVQDSNGTTVVCLPCEMVSADLTSILARYCQVRCLNMERLSSGELLCQLSLPEWRDLHHFRLDMTHFQDDNFSPIRESPVHEEQKAHFPSTIPGKMYPTPCLRHALVEVYFQDDHSNQGSMSYLLNLLTSCPNLQAIKANHVYIDGSEPTPCPPWSTYQLRSFSLGLRIQGRTTDNISLEEAVALATASADRIALAFMDQLGHQTNMREMQLQLNNRGSCGPSPFLDLAVGPKNGLGQFAKLARLESLVIIGLTHRVGSVEMEWMAKHWPRLQTIELPVFDPDDPTKQANRGNYARAMLDWTPWFPRLQVRVPYHNLS